MASIVVKMKSGQRAVIDATCGAVLAWVEEEDGTVSVVSITGHKVELAEKFVKVMEDIREAEAIELGLVEFVEEPAPSRNGRARKRVMG